MLVRIGSKVKKEISPLSQLSLDLESPAAPPGKAPMRRCLVTGESLATSQLLRFAISPDGMITFDVKRNLGGRGLWVTAQQAVLQQAIAQSLFQKAAKQAVVTPENLLARVELVLKERVLNLLKRAELSGEMVLGFEKCLSQLRAMDARLLIHASDASEDGMKKLNKQSDEVVKVVEFCSRAELAEVLNSANPVHLVVKSSKLAKVIYREYTVWARFIGKDGL